MVKRERSRSYPSVNLEKAIEDTKQVRTKLGRGKIDKEQISVALGYQSYNGKSGTRISTMVQFGLLEKKDGYSLSKLSEKITHPKDQVELDSAILEAFKTPELYSELVERYLGDGRFPDQLENILCRDFGITASASQEATRRFIESAQFAKLIDENKIFITSNNEELDKLEEFEQTIYIPTPTNRHQRSEVVDMVPVTFGTDSHNSPFDNDRKQTFNFSLTDGKFAQLMVPTGLKVKDIQILRKQIELLELQVEEA